MSYTTKRSNFGFSAGQVMNINREKQSLLARHAAATTPSKPESPAPASASNQLPRIT